MDSDYVEPWIGLLVRCPRGVLLLSACRALGLGFRFQKPEPEALGRALIRGSMQT